MTIVQSTSDEQELPVSYPSDIVIVYPPVLQLNSSKPEFVF